MPLLERLFHNPAFNLIAGPILLLILIVMMTQDWRAFRKKGPIRIWYLRDPIYPDDVMYPWARFERFKSYIGCGSAIVILFVIFAVIWIASLLRS